MDKKQRIGFKVKDKIENKVYLNFWRRGRGKYRYIIGNKIWNRIENKIKNKVWKKLGYIK